MGNSSPTPSYSKTFNQSFWQTVQRNPSQTQQPYNKYKLLRNRLTNQQIQQYRVQFIDEDEYKYYIQSFLYRQSESALVNTKYLVDKHVENICSTTYCSDIYIENIPFRLTDVMDIPYPDNLYMLESAFNGFAKLFRALGCYFTVTQNLICIDSNAKVKVWLNANLSKNYPDPAAIIEHLCQPNMVKEIIELIGSNTDHQSEPESFQHFLQEEQLVDCNFEDIKKALTQYAAKHSVDIPNYFESMFHIISDGKDSQQDEDDTLKDQRESNIGFQNNNISNGSRYNLDRKDHMEHYAMSRQDQQQQHLQQQHLQQQHQQQQHQQQQHYEQQRINRSSDYTSLGSHRMKPLQRIPFSQNTMAAAASTNNPLTLTLGPQELYSPTLNQQSSSNQSNSNLHNIQSNNTHSNNNQSRNNIHNQSHSNTNTINHNHNNNNGSRMGNNDSSHITNVQSNKHINNTYQSFHNRNFNFSHNFDTLNNNSHTNNNTINNHTINNQHTLNHNNQHTLNHNNQHTLNHNNHSLSNIDSQMKNTSLQPKSSIPRITFSFASVGSKPSSKPRQHIQSINEQQQHGEQEQSHRYSHQEYAYGQDYGKESQSQPQSQLQLQSGRANGNVSMEKMLFMKDLEVVMRKEKRDRNANKDSSRSVSLSNHKITFSDSTEEHQLDQEIANDMLKYL